MEKVEEQVQSKGKKKEKKQKSLNFDEYGMKKLAFKFSYIGFNYQGLTIQKHTDNTGDSPGEWGYSRCGRTDRGVSALGNVFAVNVRNLTKLQSIQDAKRANNNSQVQKSNELKEEEQSKDQNDCNMTELEENNNLNREDDNKNKIKLEDDNSKEISEKPQQKTQKVYDIDQYVLMINNLLPEDIRIHGYAVVPPYFDARFSCLYREYKYFFNLKRMDLDKMKRVANKIIGTHDFRNFCKKDDSAVIDDEEEQNFIRRIFSIKFQPVFGEESTNSHPLLNMYVCIIKGSAFLWHQIRYTMAILFMIGEGKEDESIVDYLLDVEKVTEKPHYVMANDKPLILSNCYFEGILFNDILKGYIDNYINCENLVEQKCIELCVNNTVFEHFSKIFLPSSYLKLPSSIGSLKNSELNKSDGLNLSDIVEDYKQKKRVTKAITKIKRSDSI